MSSPVARAGRPPGLVQPIGAGAAGAAIGFFGSFAVLHAGLAAAGATEAQAASALLVLCLLQGALSSGLSLVTRLPIAMAWSTPGAALLAAAHLSGVPFSDVVGAFAVSSAVVLLAGAVPALVRLIERIPVPISGALLAGILLPFCIAPVTAAARTPLTALPLIAVWLVLQRVAPRWAAPTALVLAIALTLVTGAVPPSVRLPAPVLVPPGFDPAVAIGLGLPLAVVTMAGQNLPGLAVLRSNGYRPPTRLLLVACGLASLVAAPFGGHSVNLAAITGAITVGPEAGPDPARRWVAGVSNGAAYLVLGLGAALFTSLVASSQPLLIEAGAGLALIGAFGGGLQRALEEPAMRLPALATLLVVGSGVTIAGLSAAFWGLVVGVLLVPLLRRRTPVA